ncbi:MAG: HesA/MoeB/ThiF family protein [Pirellulales bacterium]|nr:HesA/MoeB/ThiF family protein [Pirellulales bacterium]
MTLSAIEMERYSRQMMMDGWGEPAQNKLKESTVFIAGAGGLGSPVTIYLAIAGVGHLRICDFDIIQMSNLNRQILHDPARIGMNKALSAELTLRAMNPDIRVTAITEKITDRNADDLIGDADLVIDCTDNFPTRYILNEAALGKHIPLVHGAIWGMDGRITFIHPPETPCLRCMIPEPPPQETCPVLGATPGVIGTLQVLEAIKYLTGIGELLKGQLLAWEGEKARFVKLTFPRDPNCPTCGDAVASLSWADENI